MNYKDYNWHDETILIADDDKYSCMLLEKILSKTGAKIICARDGQEALDIINSNSKISIAILDIIMPKLSGIEVVSIARKTRPDLLFIACTADVVRMNQEKCIELGFNNSIAKPFLPIKLFKAICEGILVRSHAQD